MTLLRVTSRLLLTSSRMQVIAARVESAAPAGEPAAVHLVLEDAQGHRGRGEAAFAPGSPAALATRQALEALEPDAVRLTVGLPLVAQLERWRGLLPAHLPEARYALETAALELLALQRQLPAWRLLTATPRPAAPCAALDAARPEDARRAAEEAWAAGVRTFRVELGAELQQGFELAEQLRREHGRGLRLRLGGARLTSHQEARRLLVRLDTLEPEYVEEPLAGEELPALAPSYTPLALARCLEPLAAWPSLSGYLQALNVKALALDPRRLGGLARALRYAERARRHELAVVVTHSLGGPVARAGAAALALAVGSPERASGLPLIAAPRSEAAGALAPWGAPGLGV